jgi:hypothetical protein
VLVKDAFHTASSLWKVSPMMFRGTCKNPFTCNGNNVIAKVIAVTIVCLTERKKEKHLVMAPSNIMVNGHSSVYMGFRFAF